MKKILWKVKFSFWAMYYGMAIGELIFWSQQCYIENHDGKHRVLTPKQAGREVVSWSRK